MYNLRAYMHFILPIRHESYRLLFHEVITIIDFVFACTAYCMRACVCVFYTDKLN